WTWWCTWPDPWSSCAETNGKCQSPRSLAFARDSSVSDTVVDGSDETQQNPADNSLRLCHRSCDAAVATLRSLKCLRRLKVSSTTQGDIASSTALCPHLGPTGAIE
ncbi:unnamed protein product, partial [Ectocarpus sp. 13 AM-2016]